MRRAAPRRRGSRAAGCRPLPSARSRIPAEIRSSSDRKSTRLNSSHSQISYAVFCLKKKKHMSTRARLVIATQMECAVAYVIDSTVHQKCYEIDIVPIAAAQGVQVETV